MVFAAPPGVGAALFVSRKPPARQVVQKKPVGDDVEIKTPFVVK